MKISLQSLLALGLAALLTSSPALADSKHKRHDERNFGRGDRHERSNDHHRDRRYHNDRGHDKHYDHDRRYYSDRRYYGRDRSPRPTFYYHRHYNPRHYDHRDSSDSYLKWIGGAILLNELLHYHGGRACYDHH